MKRLTLILVVLSMAGCASMTAEMDLPEELAGAVVMPVENRRMLELGSKPMLDFAGWQVTRFSRGWTREAVSDLFWTKTVDRTQRYAFVLAGAAEPIDVVCGAMADLDRWAVIDVERVQSYELRCEGIVAGEENELFTLEVGTRVGHLEWAGERLLVIPTSGLKDSSWKFQDRTGYVIEDDDGPIAAVEVLSPGRVWMLDEVADELKDVVAAATSALLLYDNLLEE